MLDRAEARARTQEASLRSATDILMRVKEIAIRANNGTYNAVDRETFALEVRSLNDQLLALANTQDAEGNAVFAGAATGSLAFQKDAEGIVHYQGDTTDVELSVGRNRALNIARPGTTFFSSVAVPEGARVSSDTELAGFTVETSVGAEAAQYSVAVTQLARAQKTTSSVFSSASLPLNGGNPLKFSGRAKRNDRHLNRRSPDPAGYCGCPELSRFRGFRSGERSRCGRGDCLA